MTIEEIKKMQLAHYKSTTPMDEYFTGFYNGIEYILCNMEKREPDYFHCEKPTTEKRRLESLILGHQEAMRPLLEEWVKLK